MYAPFLKELNKQYLNKIYSVSNLGTTAYIKQQLNANQDTLERTGDRQHYTTPTGSLIINGNGTTTPPVFLQFSDQEDIWYTKNPIKIINGKIQINQETVSDKPNGTVISNPAMPLPSSKETQSPYTLNSGAPVSVANVKAARTQTAETTRQGSQATTEIYRRVLADPLPWEPNQWIELGEEVRMANGELILKDGKPIIEFWYINPTTKKSEYILPQGGVIRDLAVSSSIGQELEKLRNQYSARETSAIQDATLTVALNVDKTTTLEQAKAVAKEGVQQSFIPKYSTHPEIKEAYEQLAKSAVAKSAVAKSAGNLAPSASSPDNKYLKMKKMGIPPPAIIIKIKSDATLSEPERTELLALMQQGGQRGGLPPGPAGLGGLGALFAARSSGSGPPGPPRPPSTPSQATTKLNEAGMQQLKDLVEKIKTTPAYDIIVPANPHPLFICSDGTCSVDPKYKDSVLEAVVAKTQKPTPAPAPAASTKLTIDDFIQMKGIMDRTSLIAFMKSTYKVDKDFNVDIQKVFPNITTDEITTAISEYGARQKKVKNAPAKTDSPENQKLKAAKALANAVSKRKESGNAVTPYEEYTETEITILKQIDALNSKENADSIPKLTEEIATHKKSLAAAISEGRVKGFHVTQLFAKEKQLNEQKKRLKDLMETPGFNDKYEFIRNKKPLITTAPNGRKVIVDPKARTVTNIKGGTRRKGAKTSKTRKNIKYKR